MDHRIGTSPMGEKKRPSKVGALILRVGRRSLLLVGRCAPETNNNRASGRLPQKEKMAAENH